MGTVNIPQYPDNSSSARYNSTSEEAPAKVEERAEKVVEGAVVRKKKGLGKKFAETFINEDAGSVKEYVFMDVIIPALKDTLYNVVSNSVSMFLFGSRGPSVGSGGRNNYNSISTSRRVSKSSYGASEPRRGAYIRPEDRKAAYLDDIEFESIADANKVLDKMLWRLNEYHVVTVADFYDYAGITPDYTDSKYGWENLDGSYVKRGYGGVYYIILPRAELLV